MVEVPQTVVVTGVAGSGKSTVSEALAARTGAVVLDADDFHPAANVAKMASGTALTDADREPWIDALADEIARRAACRERVVLACSALRRAHRSRLRSAADDVVLVHLDVSVPELRRRLVDRVGHFMPAALLDSQLEALELPDPERTVLVDADGPVEEVVDEVLRRVGRS
ncbi:MAG TPA: gluconokinase [Acidimicrobiales bacterium]|nr:gluconokinase [Acidimicrobiales bacterium]